MKNIKFFIVLTAILYVNILFSQDFRLGKVSKEELQEKVHPLDSTAVAAVLYKKGTTQFDFDNRGDFMLNTQVEVRIKIYKKEGFDFANFSLPYYVGGLKESVSFDDVVTYNLENGKIEKTKIKKEGEFEEKINENWNVKKIVLPNIKEGSVIEYKYTYKSPYLTSIPDWYFQQGIPVNNVTYNVVIPEYYNYGIVLNSTDIKVKQDLRSQTKTFTSSQNTGYGTSSAGTSSLQTVTYNETHTLYSGENLPAIDGESFINNIRNYAAFVKHELSMIKFPNSFKDLSTTWEDVAKTIYKNDNFGKELNQKSYFEDDLNKILTPGMSENEKIQTILSFVKQNIKWNNKNGMYCDQGVKKAYKGKSGNSADINLMLIAMLRHVGLDANPVLVSTRDNGISVFPKINAYNYVIAAVESNNEIILLDATNPNTSPNILPIKTINWKGRLLRETGSSKEISLTPRMLSKKVIYLMADIDQNGGLSGKVRHQNYDYNAFTFRENYGNEATATDSYLENLESRYGNIEIGDDYKRTNANDLSKPISEDFSFTNGHFTDIIGNEIYFSPMTFYKWSKNPFTKEERKYPIDFIYPSSDKYILNYTIPDGYTVKSMPEPLNIALPDNIGSFKILLNNTDNKIQVSVDFVLNEAFISELYYPEIKDFFKQVFDKQNEKIVLTKI